MEDKSAKKKTPSKGEKRQSSRGKASIDDVEPQHQAKRSLRLSPGNKTDTTQAGKRKEQTDKDKAKNPQEPVRKSPRHTRPTTESSSSEAEDELDATLTGSSKSDSETPTIGKG